jgi:hypothetical protein
VASQTMGPHGEGILDTTEAPIDSYG